VIATDLSRAAAAVAALNAERTGLGIEVVVGDLFDPLPAELAGRVDLVVSNPPYVAAGEWDGLPVDVRREPRMALVAGPLGTEVLDRIAAGVPRWLRPGGRVVCELGETQGAHARHVFGAALDGVAVEKDLTGRTRFVVGTAR
jgi:release factor glutamine methyltransferase